MVDTANRAVRRHDNNREIVNLDELVFFRLCRTRHAAEFAVHTEIVLERNRRERLGFALNFDAFLRFDGLMQTVRITASFHETSREFVDDDDFIVADNVIAVAFHEGFRAQCRRKTVRKLEIFRCIEVFDTENTLDFRHGAVGRGNGFLLFVNRIIRAFLESGDGFCHDDVHIRRFRTRSRNDERRTRFIDEDRVNLVDDRIVQVALNHLVFVEDHVVTQIVKTELVVRTERDIAAVRIFTLREIHVVRNEADTESEIAVQTSHPLAVAAGEVIVDRDHVDAFSRQGIEINRQCCNKRFTFTGTHLCDTSFVQAHTADELNVKMTHTEYAARTFADNGKRLRQQVVERLAVRKTFAEHIRISRQLIIRQSLHLRLESIDFIDDSPVAGDLFIVIVA